MDVRFKSETHLLKLQQGTKKLPFSVVFPRPPLLPLAQQVDAAAALVTYIATTIYTVILNTTQAAQDTLGALQYKENLVDTLCRKCFKRLHFRHLNQCKIYGADYGPRDCPIPYSTLSK